MAQSTHGFKDGQPIAVAVAVPADTGAAVAVSTIFGAKAAAAQADLAYEGAVNLQGIHGEMLQIRER